MYIFACVGNQNNFLYSSEICQSYVREETRDTWDHIEVGAGQTAIENQNQSRTMALFQNDGRIILLMSTGFLIVFHCLFMKYVFELEPLLFGDCHKIFLAFLKNNKISMAIHYYSKPTQGYCRAWAYNSSLFFYSKVYFKSSAAYPFLAAVS